MGLAVVPQKCRNERITHVLKNESGNGKKVLKKSWEKNWATWRRFDNADEFACVGGGGRKKIKYFIFIRTVPHKFNIEK